MIKVISTHKRPNNTVEWENTLGWGLQDDAEEINAYFNTTYKETGKQISRRTQEIDELTSKSVTGWDSQTSFDQFIADTFINEKWRDAAILYREANGITNTRVIKVA
jgi:hypothetical protein